MSLPQQKFVHWTNFCAYGEKREQRTKFNLPYFKGSNPIFIDINMAIPQNRNKQATVLIMHWKVNSETFIPVPENKFVKICILFWDDILKPNNEYNLIPKPINEPNNNV